MPLGTSTRGLIYDYFPEDSSPVVDITDRSSGVSLRYSPDDDPSNVIIAGVDPSTAHAVPQPVLNALNNVATTGPGGLPVFSVPLIVELPRLFQTQWSALLPQLPTALEDRAASQLPQNTTLSQASFPRTGLVRARQISNGPLLLDFWISSISARLAVNPFLDVVVHFTFTVDLELLFMVFTNWPESSQVIPIQILANAKIQATTGIDQAELAAADALWNWLHPQDPGAAPSNQIALAEQQIDYTDPAPPPQPGSPPSAAYSGIIQAAQTLAAALAALGSAGPALGLLQAGFVVDATSETPLNFIMVHPVDPAPQAFNPQVNAGPIWPLFTHPTLGTSQTQVVPGTRLVVTGTYFPPANQVGIAWTNTCSGDVTSAAVEWGEEGQAQTVTTIAAPAFGGPGEGGFLFVPPSEALEVGESYTFQARNSDALTTTQPSNSVTIQVPGPVNLVLSYQSNAPGPISLRGVGGNRPSRGGKPASPAAPHPRAAVVGTVDPGSDGTFAVTITVPPDAVPNTTPATLCANAFGQSLVCTQLPIVATIQPVLNLVNPDGTIASPDVIEGYPNIITARGEGFIAGHTAALYVDQSQGNPVATATVEANGTFTCTFAWPVSIAPGNHSLIGIEQTPGQTVEATLIISEDEPLQ